MANVSMREMGRRLGVSAVTVSKALAGKSGVSEEKRKEILQLAQELGYVNPIWQMAPQKRLDVGILVPEKFFAPDAFYAMFCKRLLQALTDAGHFGMLELVAEGMEKTMTLPTLLRSGRVEGLILLGQLDISYAKLLAEQEIPVIALDFHYPDLLLDAVVSDGTGGAAKLTEHLLAQGHREIGFLGNIKATSFIMERYLGFVSAMTRQGLSVRPEWILLDREENNVPVPIVLPETLPTAFVCNCDVMAQALVEALRRRGLRVPEDVSVVGYDDFIPQPGLLPLTTYRVHTEAMSHLAVRLLEQRRSRMDGPCGCTTVSGDVIYRESVAAR